MQYILTELEFQDYQRLKLIENSFSGDDVKVDQFLSALARLQLSDWQLVLGRIPEDVLEDVGKLHQRSEQQLLKIWQDKDADFYERKLSWARNTHVDEPAKAAQNSEQLAA